MPALRENLPKSPLMTWTLFLASSDSIVWLAACHGVLYTSYIEQGAWFPVYISPLSFVSLRLLFALYFLVLSGEKRKEENGPWGVDPLCMMGGRETSLGHAAAAPPPKSGWT